MRCRVAVSLEFRGYKKDVRPVKPSAGCQRITCSHHTGPYPLTRISDRKRIRRSENYQKNMQAPQIELGVRSAPRCGGLDPPSVPPSGPLSNRWSGLKITSAIYLEFFAHDAGPQPCRHLMSPGNVTYSASCGVIYVSFFVQQALA